MELDGLLFDAGRPPMPEPTMAPMRSALASVISRPESQGHERGTEAVMDERVHLLASLRDPELAEQFIVGGDVESLDLTCNLGGEPIHVGIRTLVSGPMPERPWVMPSQPLARSLPNGETIPRPVTTTRRFIADSPDPDDFNG
jgi:hypothetical protein